VGYFGNKKLPNVNNHPLIGNFPQSYHPGTDSNAKKRKTAKIGNVNISIFKSREKNFSFFFVAGLITE
jgi:hypothetical protein